MANRIITRHGSTTPTTSDLEPYELGWDGSNLYINNNGSIKATSNCINMGHFTSSSFSGTISSPEDMMFAILEKMVSSYSGFSNTIFTGSFTYYCAYSFEMFVYGTSSTTTTTFNSNSRTVPNYSNGFFYCGYASGSGQIKYVGTNAGVFTEHSIDIYARNFIVGGHNSAIGTTKTDGGNSYSIPSLSGSSNATQTASLTLEKGVWVVTASVSFVQDTSGLRYATLNTEQALNYYCWQQVYASSSGSTALNLAHTVTVTADSTTYSVYVLQTSTNGALTSHVYMKAVRIA